MPDFEKAGIPVFKPYEEYKAAADFGGFRIMPFELVHDVPCYGFYITHPESGTVIYLSDTQYCKWRFPGVNHIICECHHTMESLDGYQETGLRNRVLQTHMGLDTCRDFIRANKSPFLRNVILCHMGRNSDSGEYFVSEIQKAAGANVNVKLAEPGLRLELNKDPF